MKKMLKKLMKNERGFALPLVLVLLLLGGLIISPLLGYVSTGLRVGKSNENLMERLYAADAGVEDALWYLITDNITVPDGGSASLPESTINSKTVNVTIKDKSKLVYEITSVATDASGSNTNLEVYVKNIDYSGLLNNLATSLEEITWKNNTNISGNISDNYSEEDWPIADLLMDFYLSSVNTSDPYLSDTIDVADFDTIGPVYRDGDLTIINTGIADDTLTLTGTIYVTGKIQIGTTNKAFTLNLNGQTIFSEDPIKQEDAGGEAIGVGGKSTFTGSGCIIAVGYINFQPNMNTNPGDFIFIMSIEDVVWFHPNGDFYGSIAGSVSVDLFQGDFVWVDWHGKGINFPTEEIKLFDILAWQVSP